MFHINRKLLPIKAHYFFFLAAMGPILPQIPVFGKQLGISADVMGFITCVLPLMYIIAKPLVGYLADLFPSQRKLIFMMVIIIMTFCYGGFYFIPTFHHQIAEQDVYSLTNLSNNCTFNNISNNLLCQNYRAVICRADLSEDNQSFEAYLAMKENNEVYACSRKENHSITYDDSITISCVADENVKPDCLYKTGTFVSFVILMCIGTIGFNVTNCISDAICFDMLGDKAMKYGAQRVWGTVGFGLAALVSGIAVDYWTKGDEKSITPALIILIICSTFDLFSVVKLKLPNLSTTDSIFRDVGKLIRRSDIAIFLVFATISGILEAFVIYYMFWHLENVAQATGHMGSIKLIEGLVVAAECLGGEILFFLISGRILKKIGYVHCLSFCLFAYSVRLVLISMISNPWYLIPIELVMQGATYALCYTCVVAYASAIAPPGTSATVQGLVAGMDDGVGFSIGSLIGGQIFERYGGTIAFRIFSLIALFSCAAHIILRPASKHHLPIDTKTGYNLPSDQMSIENSNEMPEIIDEKR